MVKQNLTRKIIGKVAEKIPLKYFAAVMGGIGIGSSLTYYITKIAYNQCDDPSVIGITDYTDFLNCTGDVPGVPDGSYIETPANVDDKMQPGPFSELIRLNSNEPVEKIGKQGGLELELRVDPVNGTVDVAEITEVLPMPSSYNEETLHLDEPLFLNSTKGNTYEIKVMDFGNEQAILEITKQETGESVTEIVKEGYREALNFGNETFKLYVKELFNGIGDDGKFLKVCCETDSNK